MLRVDLCHPCSVSRLFCSFQPSLFSTSSKHQNKKKSFYANTNIKTVWPCQIRLLLMMSCYATYELTQSAVITMARRHQQAAGVQCTVEDIVGAYQHACPENAVPVIQSAVDVGITALNTISRPWHMLEDSASNVRVELRCSAGVDYAMHAHAVSWRPTACLCPPSQSHSFPHDVQTCDSHAQALRKVSFRQRLFSTTTARGQ
jgi:hypothetical protein